jgi:hypothetical protein
VVHAILSVIGHTDLIEAQKKMHEELNFVYDNFIKFATGFFHAIMSKYFAPEIIAECCEKIEDAPCAFDVWIPFYVEPPKEGQVDPNSGPA